jgi:hypothetical protein
MKWEPGIRFSIVDAKLADDKDDRNNHDSCKNEGHSQSLDSSLATIA